MTTRASVRFADRFSTALITVGGIATIVAVSGVFLFLVSVALPLIKGGSAKELSHIDRTHASVTHLGTDEYGLLAWTLDHSQTFRLFRTDTGDLLREERVTPGDSVRSVTAVSSGSSGNAVAFGFSDGSIQILRLQFQTDYPGRDELNETPPETEGTVRSTDGGVVEMTDAGQLRRHRLALTLTDPLVEAAGDSIVAIAQAAAGNVVALMTGPGVLRITAISASENLMTGEMLLESSGSSIQTPFATGAPRAIPDVLMVAESATNATLIWNDGTAARYETDGAGAISLAGSSNVLEGGDRLTASARMAGGTTLLVGGEQGVVFTTFARGGGAESPFETARARRFEIGKGAPITALASAERNRMFAAGNARGRIELRQATSGARVTRMQLDEGDSPEMLSITPRGDGLVVLSRSGFRMYHIAPGHPEATLTSLFLPVWYEGYPAPAHVWQSTGGTDDFEPKLGMWPLVFGTLKATFYSMLFGVPLAILAAIFTTEFLSPRIRPRIKTTVESMASLPSVVLGFLGALVFAPFVQRNVSAVVGGFVALPLVFLIGAYLYQLLPQGTTLRLARWRLVMLLGLMPIGTAMAGVVGPVLEQWLFAGDVVSWLDGQQGTAFGGWVLLVLPVSVFVSLFVATRWVAQRFRQFAAGASRRAVALADLIRFVAIAAMAVALSLVLAGALTAIGLDPRGSGMILGTYIQRNALVVGFVMGFAIIPIIYTIAEDALSAVPEHLRAASLGAGATQWQTAIRIVLPTAMSGLFSAVMIGLGRAVGETMIVLMAAGNTPILEMNIFNGFRTLSANIAVELPEAVRDSTHYRTLFLAALLLFFMTFLINTVAELVRQRYRRRSAQI